PDGPQRRAIRAGPRPDAARHRPRWPRRHAASRAQPVFRLDRCGAGRGGWLARRTKRPLTLPAKPRRSGSIKVEEDMAKLEIIGMPQSTFVRAVRMVCEEKGE